MAGRTPVMPSAPGRERLVPDNLSSAIVSKFVDLEYDISGAHSRDWPAEYAERVYQQARVKPVEDTEMLDADSDSDSELSSPPSSSTDNTGSKAARGSTDTQSPLSLSSIGSCSGTALSSPIGSTSFTPVNPIASKADSSPSSAKNSKHTPVRVAKSTVASSSAGISKGKDPKKPPIVVKPATGSKKKSRSKNGKLPKYNAEEESWLVEHIRKNYCKPNEKFPKDTKHVKWADVCESYDKQFPGRPKKPHGLSIRYGQLRGLMERDVRRSEMTVIQTRISNDENGVTVIEAPTLEERKKISAPAKLKKRDKPSGTPEDGTGRRYTAEQEEWLIKYCSDSYGMKHKNWALVRVAFLKNFNEDRSKASLQHKYYELRRNCPDLVGMADAGLLDDVEEKQARSEKPRAGFTHVQMAWLRKRVVKLLDTLGDIAKNNEQTLERAVKEGWTELTKRYNGHHQENRRTEELFALVEMLQKEVEEDEKMTEASDFDLDFSGTPLDGDPTKFDGANVDWTSNESDLDDEDDTDTDTDTDDDECSLISDGKDEGIMSVSEDQSNLHDADDDEDSTMSADAAANVLESLKEVPTSPAGPEPDQQLPIENYL